jgi:CubicO group peptidase (beta-lactamase class C family)
MKLLRKILFYFFSFIIVFELALYFTDNLYINKTLQDTVFKGRLSPGLISIDDFDVAAIKTTPENAPKPIKTQLALSESDEKILNKYRTTAFLVLQNDTIIYENYWLNFNETTYSNSFSMAKSVVGLLVGIAIDEGKIKQLDQPISDFLENYQSPEGKKITIRHLLSMSSGINFDESYLNPFAFPSRAYYDNDITKVMLRYQPEKEPGTQWKYKGGDTQLLAMILEKSTGQSLSTYAEQKLWKPLQAKNDAYWSLDKKGGKEKASCCFHSNAQDFALLGRLIIQNGYWNGKQIISKEFLNELAKPVNIPNDENNQVDYYGLHWWLTEHNGLKVVYARGILGQYMMAIPEKNMVIVRLGYERNKVQERNTPLDVFEYIQIALNLQQ